MLRKRGFTLIELLVVIAIIGILSAIVLASLNSARNKANAAKVQSQLASARAAAEIYYATNSNYSTTEDCDAGMFSDTGSGMNQLLNGMPSGTTLDCSATGSAFAIGASNSGAGINWCVDSTGRSATSSAGAAASGVCTP